MRETFMDMKFKLPPFGKLVDMFNEAGIRTKSGRGFWGGVTDEGEIIVTSWIDSNDGDGRFYIWCPKTNHGGLKAQWEVGNIRVGTAVRMILLRQRGNVPIGKPGRSVAGAALMPGKWRVAEIVSGKDWQAMIEYIDLPFYRECLKAAIDGIAKGKKHDERVSLSDFGRQPMKINKILSHASQYLKEPFDDVDELEKADAAYQKLSLSRTTDKRNEVARELMDALRR
jgi:hypothetical protein